MDVSSNRSRRDTDNSDKDSDISIRRPGSRNRDVPVGILRLDIGRPRRSSVELKYLSQGEPPSPQPSVDRLSVTFADDSIKSDSSTRYNYFNPNISPVTMDKVHFPPVTDEENSDEEDYSASVTAIMSRRQSTRRSRRRSSRRASSPFSPDILPGSENGRRRSSVFTTSSGDTAITVDESLAPEVTQEQIFENIRLHKEVLSSVKMQPWNMRKKLRLVVQAKSYIKRHEGALQERLAQSHSTRDMLARCNLYLVQKWHHYRREAANISNWLIPWEKRIKEIESHFGSVVASYFIFLRWLFWVNLVLSSILLAFVYIPETMLASIFVVIEFLIVSSAFFVPMHDFNLNEVVEGKSLSEGVKLLLYTSKSGIGEELQTNNIFSILKSNFNRKLPTKLITHGYTDSKNGECIQHIQHAMVEKEQWNIVIVDWSPLSRSIYKNAVKHTVRVAKVIADFVIYIAKVEKLNYASLHFIGHSLGAHIMAIAADAVKERTNKTIGRITGLDPARPRFEWPEEVPNEMKLDKSDASFVDVIHTNAGGWGVKNPCGHVDFYPNGGNGQPGCFTGACDHSKSCEYWALSIINPQAFPAYDFNTWNNYYEGRTSVLVGNPMGIAANPSMPHGEYYLEIVLTANPEKAGERKTVLREERYNSTNFLTLWDFEGIFKYSPLFYGWYTNKSEKGYKLPLAYFMTGLAVYTYSFVATLRKMAENSRMSKLSEKDDECIFSWKLFTGWDYMIGNAETAHNRVASIVMSFKEALLEEAEKKREVQNWKIIASRVLVHMLVFGLLGLSAFAVIEVVRRSKESEAMYTVWRRNEVTVVITVITNFFPILFEALGYLEHYHPRKQLRMQLARIMMLNLLNLYSLIFALFDEINKKSDDLESYRPSNTSEATKILTNCHQCCTNLTTNNITSENLLNMLVVGTSLSSFPKLTSLLSNVLQEAPSTLNFTNVTDGMDFTSNYDDYLYNISFYKDNETFLFNATEYFTTTLAPKSLEENILDLKNAFQDYLSFLLSKFEVEDKLENGTTPDYNFTSYLQENYTTEDPSLYSSSSSSIDFTSERTTLYADDAYDYFMSTVAPFLTSSSDDFDNNTINNIHKNISSTVVSFIKENKEICYEICTSDYIARSKLRGLCWETMFGQELVKLTVMDLVYTVLSTLMMDFFRGLFVRVMNNCWCWDLEKKFPNYGDFKVAENILHLVNNQGMVWMGMFFSPGLVVLNVFKLYSIMYLRSWAVLTCNVPHEVIFRASRSNNFYFALLLMMLFLCVLPVGFAIVWKKPSWHCGPFSDYDRIFHILTKTLKNALPEYFHTILDYIASPAIVIPLLVLLILIIYYLVSLTNSLREANNDLKVQLRRERTEERRKMFQIADRRRNGSEGSGELANTPFGKWKKLLQTLPSAKSLDETPKGESEDFPPPTKEVKVENIKKDFLSKLLKKALRKPSITSEEDSPNGQDDGTDTEQHESLPEDFVSLRESKPQVAKKAVKPAISAFRRTINAALSQRPNKPTLEQTQKGSTDSNETKHVKIKEDVSVSVHTSEPKRKDTFDLKRNQDRIHRKLNQSSRSSSSKDLREDSLTSNWSENIPVITISKTESSENIINEKERQKEMAQSKKHKREDDIKVDKSHDKHEREEMPPKQSGDKIRSGSKLRNKIEANVSGLIKSKTSTVKTKQAQELSSPSEGPRRRSYSDDLRKYNKNKDKTKIEVDIEETPASVKAVIESKAKEGRKFIRPRDQERRPSKTRVINMETTLDPIASSNDNLDSDSQDDPLKVFDVLKSPKPTTSHAEMPIDLIKNTMDAPICTRSLERRKKPMLRKQLSEVGSDDYDEHITKITNISSDKDNENDIEKDIDKDEEKKSTNGGSVHTIDTIRTHSDTIKTESSTEYKEELISNENIE